MPLTLTMTEGVLPKGTEKATFVKLCQAMLKWHGLTDKPVMTPNVVAGQALSNAELGAAVAQAARSANG
jgi:hypothetical protein